MVFVPLYFPRHDYNYDSSPKYMYKEKRVESSYRDRVYINCKLDMDEYNKKSWLERLLSTLPEEITFYIIVDKKYTDEIERALESGEDFLTVYKKYKEKADIDDTSDYDDLFVDWADKDLTEIGEILRKGYKVDCVVAEPVTWYERDDSEREVYEYD